VTSTRKAGPHRPPARPDAAKAVILGSGLWHVLDRPGPPRRVNSAGATPGGLGLSGGKVRKTPFGPSQPIFEATFPGGARALVLTRHGERGYEIGAWNVNYRANLWALKDLGADCILATSACGGIAPDLAAGEFLVPDDILDKTTSRSKTFFEESGLGVLRHSDPFCPALRSVLAEALAESAAAHRLGGVYAAMDGPRLETPAEIRSLAAEGATVVGMTLAPEWALARELEICYAALCWVVNPAEGVKDRPYRPGVLFEGMADAEEAAAGDRAAERIPAILGAALRRIGHERPCFCRRAMERYRQRGRLGDDFRTWIGRR